MAINFQFGNFGTTHREDAIKRAGTTWDQRLRVTQAITIHACWLPYPTGIKLAAMCIPNGILGAPNCLPNTWYTTALARNIALSPKPLIPANQPDMTIIFNSNLKDAQGKLQWYDGSAGKITADQYDFESVALHEICHGLGMLGLLFVDANGQGYYGSDLLTQQIPAAFQQEQVLGFKLPQLQNLPSIFTTIIKDPNGKPLMSYQNGSKDLGSALKGVYNPVNNEHRLSLTTSQGRTFLYTPPAFQNFTSIEHIDPTQYPNSVMIPQAVPGVEKRSIDPPVLAILQELGWNLAP